MDRAETPFLCDIYILMWEQKWTVNKYAVYYPVINAVKKNKTKEEVEGGKFECFI